MHDPGNPGEGLCMVIIERLSHYENVELLDFWKSANLNKKRPKILFLVKEDNKKWHLANKKLKDKIVTRKEKPSLVRLVKQYLQ